MVRTRVAGVDEARAYTRRTMNVNRAAVMSRAAFLAATDALVEAGDALVAEPDWERFRAWLLESDALLERVWGRMDRYHLAWLNVGRDSAPPGTSLDDAGTQRYISELDRGTLVTLRSLRNRYTSPST